MKNPCKVWNMTTSTQYDIQAESPEEVLEYFKDVYDVVEVIDAYHDTFSGKNYFIYRLRDRYETPDIIQVHFQW